ncbi:MAG TPA: glycoside hydrolase family 15 protein [Pseudolabrys sp.]|nr:glycoside hydrolase family 15 protein [Pseudolabrys sp.]
MTRKINDYALIGDCETAALVSRDGSIDWLCWPIFSGEACFAALLGDKQNGRWRIAPRDVARATRSYRDRTAILETRFETADGAVTLIDFMPRRQEEASSIVRIVEGERGRVAMRMELDLRFDYGRLIPWASKSGAGKLEFICGPHAATLHAGAEPSCDEPPCSAEFEVSAGERVPFVLQYRRSHLKSPRALNVERELKNTEKAWRAWASQCTYDGPYKAQVVRSLITIKALTSHTTGGIVAAATTSLPEEIGGKRNWDYRISWLRDATFTLLALLHSGYHEEASAWRDWLLRAVAGMARQVQPVYGVASEHRLPEWEIEWLSGFRDSRPVRAGNIAYKQLQIDVYGEVLDAMHQCREYGIPPEDWTWRLQRELVQQVERIWQEPDCGIWESRHGREHFTQSRVMAWVAVDRAVRAAEKYKLDWPVERWRKLRETIHRDVCENGYDAKSGGFMRSYETREPDGANLLIPMVGFLRADDEKVRNNVALTERKLMQQGYVLRYDTKKSEDGLPGDEGVFLACSFWYVDNLIMQGRQREAREKFEELLGVCNDVGLLSEEYDPSNGELLGNFPQALSHLALVNSAHNLSPQAGPAHSRSGDGGAKAQQETRVDAD